MVKRLSAGELKKLVLASFEAERTGDTKTGKKLIHKDFAVVEMCEWFDGKLFRRIGGDEARKLMDKAFAYQNRDYEFIHLLADEEQQTVIVEFVESYPDPKTGQVYRTPQIAVCEVKGGKIYRTRHYMDPRLGLKNLTKEDIKKALS